MNRRYVRIEECDWILIRLFGKRTRENNEIKTLLWQVYVEEEFFCNMGLVSDVQIVLKFKEKRW